MKKRLGIISASYARPLFDDLIRSQTAGFNFTEDVPAKLAIALRQGSLDGAFLCPVDVAKESSRYKFFRIAFYHGILKDIPEIRLYPLHS